VTILAKNSPNSGLQGAYVMATNKCGTELLHLDATFFSDGGKVWTLPVPFCSTCCFGEGAVTNAA
jgi:hypothetical protein